LNYGIYINNVSNGSANYGIYDASGADWVLDGDNQKIRIGEGNSDFELYSDGTNARIDSAVMVVLGNKLAFTQTDGNEYIDSLNTGYMDYGATTAHRFGTSGDTTNYLNIASNGRITLHGTARTTECMWLNAGGIKSPGGNPATFVECGLTGVWSFLNTAVEANQESVSGTLKIPCNMDRSVAPTFHIGWHTAVANNGNARWNLEYLWIGANDDTCAAAQESIEVTSASSSTADGMVFVTFTGVDLPSGTDLAMLWKITRESADDLDTIADTVEMRGAAFTNTVNKLGA